MREISIPDYIELLEFKLYALREANEEDNLPVLNKSIRQTENFIAELNSELLYKMK